MWTYGAATQGENNLKAKDGAHDSLTSDVLPAEQP
jgi:hypothetical protein